MPEEEVTKVQSPLRKLADKGVTVATKKQILIQRGGFLVPLLSAILPTIASLIFRTRNA